MLYTGGFMLSNSFITRPLLRYCVLCALCIFTASAAAQLSAPRPTVTRALDLIQDFAPRVPLGTEAVFRPRPTTLAKAIVDSGVQVRVFGLLDNETKPSRVSTIGDCDIYLSVVRRLERNPDGGLRFARLDQGWINISNSGQSPKDGRWFLVFEQQGPTEAQFRIRTIDAESYFGTGFVVTVFDTGSVPFGQIRAEYDRREGEGARLLREVDQKDPRVPCYSYSRVRVAGQAEETLVVSTDECTKPAELPSTTEQSG